MITKQYKPQSSDVTTAQRLEAYATQGRSYRKTRQNSNVTTGNLLKGSLTALIPLAAAGTLNAQCQGPVNGGATIALGRNGQFAFDVDGDGVNDFKIQHNDFFSNTYGGGSRSRYSIGFVPYGSNHIINQRGRFGNIYTAAKILPSAYVVTRGNGGINFPQKGNLNRKGFTYQVSSYSGYRYTFYTRFAVGDFAPGTRGYLGIRKGDATTGIPGWIEVELISFNKSGASLKIYERGYEGDGDNSAITGQCTALPVEMLYFNSKVQDKQALLQWATATELNNEGFEVQRSTDGRNFAKIGWVSGQGTTQEQQTYTFTDDAILPNTIYYYRLKQMDFDGTTEYSKITTVTLKDDNHFGVSEAFPNPTTNSTAFQLHLPKDSDLQLMVFDLSGRLVKEHTTSVSAGSSLLPLNTADLPQGQYFVKLQFGNAVEYRKVVVQ